MWDCDPQQMDLGAKAVVLFSILLTIIDRALPESAIASFNTWLAHQADQGLTALTRDFWKTAAETGGFVLVLMIFLPLVWSDAAMPLAWITAWVRSWGGDLPASLLVTPMGLKIAAPVIGGVLGVAAYVGLWLVILVSRLHPYGALGLGGWLFDARDVMCGMTSLAG